MCLFVVCLFACVNLDLLYRYEVLYDLCVCLLCVHLCALLTSDSLYKYEVLCDVCVRLLCVYSLDIFKGAPLKAPKATLGSVPCACVLVSPLNMNRLLTSDLLNRYEVLYDVFVSLLCVYLCVSICVGSCV